MFHPFSEADKVGIAPISSSHVATRSPLVMRMETTWETGSLFYYEYERRNPRIEAEGDFTDASRKFYYVISSLGFYLTKAFMHDLPSLRDYPGRYEIDFRRNDYRMLLGEANAGGFYRHIVFGTHDIGRIRDDLWRVHERLCEVHSLYW